MYRKHEGSVIPPAELCKSKDFNKPRRTRSSRRLEFPRKFYFFLRVLRALRGKKNAFTQPFRKGEKGD